MFPIFVFLTYGYYTYVNTSITQPSMTIDYLVTPAGRPDGKFLALNSAPLTPLISALKAEIASSSLD